LTSTAHASLLSNGFEQPKHGSAPSKSLTAFSASCFVLAEGSTILSPSFGFIVLRAIAFLLG
jgi:hypothetical protein